MTDSAPQKGRAALASSHLCTAEFEVGGGLVAIGQTPFGDQRLGGVTGGRFFGPRLEGLILPLGGNWSRSGRLGTDSSVGTFDARAVWQTTDGALISLSYTGRSVVPDDVRRAFADPTAPPVDPARYYLRIAAVFETASPDLEWLNGILAVGVGERTAFGVRHIFHQVG